MILFYIGLWLGLALIMVSIFVMIRTWRQYKRERFESFNEHQSRRFNEIAADNHRVDAASDVYNETVKRR